MNRFKSVICVCLLLLPINFANAILNEIGVNPFQTDVGVRPLAMGAAFTGLADDNNAALYNPGGLAWAKGISLTFKDFDNFSAVQTYPTGYGSSLGLALINSQISSIPIAAGTANSSSNLVLLSYGSKLSFLPFLYQEEAWQRVGVGLNLKWLSAETLRRSTLTDRSATGINLDLGILWKAADWWNCGLTLQNILPGASYKWDVGGDEPVPVTYRFGGSAKIIGDIGSPYFMEGNELVAVGELDLSSVFLPTLKLGGEWAFNKQYFLRAGLLPVLNLGAGLRQGEWGADLAIYREPLSNSNFAAISASYFPKDWVIIKKLEGEKPKVLILEEAIEQISLEDNIVSYSGKIDVVGKVKAGVDVYIDGLRAAVNSQNVFKTTVPLQIGKNLIIVEVRFEGEKKTWKYKVLRKAKLAVAEEKTIKVEAEKAVTPTEKETARKKRLELNQKKAKAEELVTLGVIEVSPEAEFKLEASITRGELATWLVKAAGLKISKVETDVFPDVKISHPFAAYIKAAADWDLMKPFQDGTFRPDSPVAKEEGERLFKVLGISAR